MMTHQPEDAVTAPPPEAVADEPDRERDAGSTGAPTPEATPEPTPEPEPTVPPNDTSTETPSEPVPAPDFPEQPGDTPA